MKINKYDSKNQIKSLLSWYRKFGRSLPWRNTNDPYNIFISEIMLQQTQVSRVLEYYPRFLDQFPDWESLSKAKTEKLIRAWSGLGYNRRALFLREAAKFVIENGVPETEEEWRHLKGVGPYTAAAVFTFTAKKPAAAIDTNVRRVIGRLLRGIAFPRQQDDNLIRKSMEKWLVRKHDWKALHALMDLGSSVCKPKKPNCATCPLRESCKARNKILSIQIIPRYPKFRERIHKGKKFPDRIYRGKILSALQKRISIFENKIGSLIDETFSYEEDQEWILRMIDRMAKEGFIEIKNKIISLKRE